MSSVNEPHALYRHYDKDGRLLYVGITNDPGQRWEQHQGKNWWHHVDTTKIERYPDRAAVESAETAAIKAERPWWNITHNDSMLRYRSKCGKAADKFEELCAELNVTIDDVLFEMRFSAEIKESQSKAQSENHGATESGAAMRLCEHLCGWIVQNGARRPRITARWLDDARRLMERDGVTEADAMLMIDWWRQSSGGEG